MEIATTVINAAVVAAVGLIVSWLVKGTIDRLENRLESEIGALRAEMNERFVRLDDRIDRGFDSIRSDLTRVALAVGARPEAEAGGG